MKAYNRYHLLCFFTVELLLLSVSASRDVADINSVRQQKQPVGKTNEDYLTVWERILQEEGGQWDTDLPSCTDTCDSETTKDDDCVGVFLKRTEDDDWCFDTTSQTAICCGDTMDCCEPNVGPLVGILLAFLILMCLCCALACYCCTCACCLL